ncbi:BRISC complex subunit FAM175B [Harpegnathos saltator]|uniref:BRCA1-A complex subunit Abraxas 1 n=1 Tax=Harpegnathos saltator TaxID=610380 RepID=E2C4M0_HARSA|nr:BRISC complex subunit FAM175B [Harpegnathos saltator]EFN77100.1 Protein FAM175A [Harpegnathos saltator]
MADDDLLVTISGAALSLLFFENVRSVSDQMGFLLGEALEFVIRSYTDSDNQVETVKIHINVEAIVTCPLLDILHNSTGRINKERLKDFVSDKSKHVIGWFRFRRSSSDLIPSLKDRLLHKQFASHFSGGNSCKEEFFLTCLLNTCTSDKQGTHKFRHVFLRRKRGIFEPIPLRISNLGDDASRHDGSDYKPTPARKSERTPDGFTELIESLNLDLTRTGGLASAMTIQREAERHLVSLIPKVCESDVEVATLEQQVRELRAKVTAQRRVKMSTINGENCAEGTKDNSLSMEKTETTKFGNDAPHPHSENNPTSHVQQSLSSQRAPHRNTAACIAKSVINQEKSRRLGLATDSHLSAQESFSTDISNADRHSDSISDIAAEPICPEGSEVLCTGDGRGRGRGRGSCGRGRGQSLEVIPGMRKTRHHVQPRERSASPKQDFSDASASPQSLTISRSYSQTTRKSMNDARKVTGSFNV